MSDIDCLLGVFWKILEVIDDSFFGLYPVINASFVFRVSFKNTNTSQRHSNNSKPLHSSYHVPETVLDTSQILAHLNLPEILWGSYFYYHPPFQAQKPRHRVFRQRHRVSQLVNTRIWTPTSGLESVFLTSPFYCISTGINDFDLILLTHLFSQ